MVVGTTSDSRGIVDNVYVRREVRYRDHGSTLNLSMTSQLRKETRGKKRENIFSGSLRLQEEPTLSYEGLSQQWLEASIVSSKGEELFAQNVNLTFGQEASWTCEELKNAHVVADICLPALQMVRNIDAVGLTNDNCQEMSSSSLIVRPATSKQQQRSKLSKW